MTKYLGGPETEEQLTQRHQRYLNMGDTGKMYQIVVDGETIGSVGYWEHNWNQQTIYEIGWSIIPLYQGKGMATSAVSKALMNAKEEKKHAFIHAFPSIENTASNALCRKLQFTLNGTCKFEYPARNWITSNDWSFCLID
jgi:RimJ/RimL family protein N-acetyltransferase